MGARSINSPLFRGLACVLYQRIDLINSSLFHTLLCYTVHTLVPNCFNSSNLVLVELWQGNFVLVLIYLVLNMQALTYWCKLCLDPLRFSSSVCFVLEFLFLDVPSETTLLRTQLSLYHIFLVNNARWSSFLSNTYSRGYLQTGKKPNCI